MSSDLDAAPRTLGEDGDEVRAAPTMLGRYRITGVLGRGGMGVVYTAHDPVLARDLAVKLLSVDVGEAAQARLLREAQAMAKLAHPNVVAVHDAGVHDHRVWVAMAKVEGVTLRRWLADDHPIDARLDVLLQAAHGLQAAHAAGLVHRDFKPDNVIVGVDAHGRVRAQVLDFGLAASAELPAGDDTSEHAAVDDVLSSLPAIDSRLTRTGAVMGTPAYMSPEQFRGQAVDARSDQFSFAVALYESVWVSRPFAGEHARSIALAVMHDLPIEPVARTRTERGLWRICSRALARDPAARYPDLGALLADVERLRARSTAPKVIAAAAVAVVVGVVATLATTREAPCTGAAALGASVWDDGRATTMREAFVATRKPWARDSATWVDGVLSAWREGWVTQHTAACRATAVDHTQSEALLDRRMRCLEGQRVAASAIADVLAQADGDTAKRATRIVGALPDLGACVPDEHGRLTDGAAADDDDARAAVRERLARAFARIDAGTLADAETELDAVAAAAAQTGDGALQARAMIARARWLDEHGDPAAREWFSRAMLTAIEHDAKAVAADAARNLAFVDGVKLGRLDAARSIADVAGALAGGESNRLLLTRAQIEFAAADYVLARSLIDRAIELAQAGGVATLGQYYNTRGAIALRAGHYAEAREDFERATADVVARLGEGHPELGRIRLNLSLALERTGLLDEAIAALQRARTVLVADLGERDPSVATTDHNLGAFLELAGRADEAIAPCERSIATFEATVGTDDPRVAGPWTVLGRAKLQRGDLDGAAAALERALVVREAALGTKHPDLALPLIARARLLLARRDAAAALGDTDRALGLIAEASFDASDRGELAMVHGWALEQVGRTVEAAAWRTVAGAMLLAAGPAGGRLGAELARGGG